MPEIDPIIVVDADPAWRAEFAVVGATLRKALGAVARRIDHVGSTSVAGLEGKPVLDIQVSVLELSPDAPFHAPLLRAGFVDPGVRTDRTQRFYREPPGTRRVHLHVRPVGSFDEQLNLLLRDYLRSHEAAAREYGTVKRALATAHRDDRKAYVLAKEPTVWKLLCEAHDWMQLTGWAPGPSDA